MCRLFETIKIINRQAFNLDYHNRRLNQAMFDLFGISEQLKLQDIIKLPLTLTGRKYKCKVTYSQTIHNIEFRLYKPKTVNTLHIVDNNKIHYPYKFEDREIFRTMLAGSDTDDILIVKNGFITDVSFANIIFYDGLKWITPSTPLLKGTKRSLLIDSGAIKEAEIRKIDIRFFSKARLINAMLDPDDTPSISTRNILY